MRPIRIALALIALALPVLAAAGDVDLAPLVEGLFDASPRVRAESRAAILGIGDHVLPRLLDAIEARQAPPRDPESEHVLQVHDVSDLVGHAGGLVVIADRIRREIDAARGQVTPEPPDHIAVRASPRDQGRVRLVLLDLRDEATRQLLVEARVVRTRGPVLPDGLGVADDFLAEILGEKRAEKLLREFEREEEYELLQAPSIVCVDQTSAGLTVGSELSYVAGFERRVAKDGTVLADPVVAKLFSGLRLDLTPVISADGKHVSLDAEITVTDVPRPIARRTVPIRGANGATADVQVPTVRELRLRQSVTLRDGGSALLSLGRAPDGQGRLLMLLTATRLE